MEGEPQLFGFLERMLDFADLTRRDLLKVTAGAAGFVLAGCAGDVRSGAGGTRSLADPIHYSSAMSLAAAVREERISAVELVDAFLARIGEVNPSLNAVVQLRADGARAEARLADEALTRGQSLGPLHGVPMTIKDSIDTEGLVSTGGTVGRAQFVPDRDATVVRRLRAAGAILLGKTNTPELTLSYETDNLVYGRTNNPWDLERTPGGSSGGATAILAAGGAGFDIGSDYGGSIRLPASFCGIAGIKPTHGRVPRTGHVFPFGGTHDSYQQLGPLARHVEDLFPILRIIAGPDNVDPAIVPMPLGDPSDVDLPSLRVGFHVHDGISIPTNEVQAVVRAAASAMEGIGAKVEESRPDGIERSFEIGNQVWSADGGAVARRLLQAAGTMEAETGVDYPALNAVALDRVLTDWYSVRSQMSGYWDNHDVILCPVNARPAGLHGATMNWAEIEDNEGKNFSYTIAYNVTGWPAGVVRGGTSPEGLPIGVQVVAAPGREDVVIAALTHLEVALGGFRPPPI
jgi:amidase